MSYPCRWSYQRSISGISGRRACRGHFRRVLRSLPFLLKWGFRQWLRMVAGGHQASPPLLRKHQPDPYCLSGVPWETDKEQQSGCLSVLTDKVNAFFLENGKPETKREEC